ncbi:RNA polymerase sigma-70 factor [Pedobacter psychrodurus]|uniref:RNA polymerase sigma factor n=1 Tax=Pedobacter psychrodurus TaxID=2530456 RepID=UPI00292D5BB9|nr:RNA polymerase sigma-70 factor [Pedobacter psychrodurus]
MHKTISADELASLRSGDLSVFNSVYLLYGRKIYALAFRFLKNQQQSEEIVQETFINLWVNREKLDVQGNIYLYLYVIAKRLCLNELRKINQSVALFSGLINRISELHNATEEEILANDMEQFVGTLLKKLPSQQQLIFKMSRDEGLSHREIAEKLQISPNTVKNHMVEALKTLKSKLNYSHLFFLVPYFFLD